MISLSNQERKRLRQIGHALNPVIMLGNQGLTENVIEETLRALNDHELIKVKVAGEDREQRAQLIQSLAEQTGAQIVQQVGKMVLLYKKAAKQNQHLSNLVRFAHLSQ
ncbi:ribosome assembly RNA-binding protein YhbY [Alkanindiges sp. WGS2144]|uniref:ribosome assembly RNA-binding protein YhbY n=1 Tax=Alkanindiges sp. WGS2144 TaxID=3366808 RepID=UPI0037513F9B